MRKICGLFVGAVIAFASIAQGVPEPAHASHGTFPTSDGIYRIPYADGTDVRVTGDHHDHTPIDRVDMTAGEGATIVAAASGWIRGIVDQHGDTGGRGDGVDINGDPQDDDLEHACGNNPPEATVVGRCTDYNNYVWIEHPNGEWSKYTHLGTGSVTSVNGWAVDDWIEAGEVLGVEDDIGQASSGGTRAFHLHHEVAVPNVQPLQWSVRGGFFPNGSATNLVPRVCGIADNLYESGETFEAGSCVNDAPTADAGGPYVVDEGTALVVDGSGSADPDGRTLTYRWDPEGLFDDPSEDLAIFVAGDNGMQTITLNVYDQVEALASSDQATVTVNNVAPTVAIDPGTARFINEGDTLTAYAILGDLGFNDTHVTSVDWGVPAGYAGVETAAPSISVDDPGNPGPLIATITASYRFGEDDEGTPFEVTVRATDDDGAATESSFEVSVENVAPELSNVSATPINEDGSTTLTGTISDPGAADGFTLYIGWGDPLSPANAETVNLPPGTTSFSVTHQYLDDNPTGTSTDTYSIGVLIADDDGGIDSTTTSASVYNSAPTIESLIVDSAIDENGTVSLTGSFSDAGSLDTHLVSIDWGDGTSSSASVVQAAGSGSFSGTHQYLDDDPSGTPEDIYTITVTVADDDLGSGTATLPVLIRNAAPVIASVQSDATFADRAEEGEVVMVSGTFTDISPLDTHVAAIDWGDGNTSAAVIVEGAGSGSFTGGHVYATGGIYSVTVTLIDDDTGFVSESVTAVVTGVGLNGGTLQIVGSEGGDHVEVFINDEGDLDVYLSIASPNHRIFDVSDVDSVAMWLGAGDDHAHLHKSVNVQSIIHGEAGSDQLWGSNQSDLIFGGDGDDRIWGRGGDDELYGDDGDDRLVGGKGTDTLVGGLGDDIERQ